MTDGSAFELLERELSLLLRRARSFSNDIARVVHPELESDAYGLLLLISREGKARAATLAQTFGVGKPTISRQLQMLDDLGLITRVPDPIDARAAVITLSDEGEDRLQKARDARLERLRQIFSRWNPSDVETLASLLKKFNEPQLIK